MRYLIFLFFAIFIFLFFKESVAKENCTTSTLKATSPKIISLSSPQRWKTIILTQEDIDPLQEMSAHKKVKEVNDLIDYLWAIYPRSSDESLYAEEYEKLNIMIMKASYDEKWFKKIVLPEMNLMPPLPSAKAITALKKIRKEEADREEALIIEQQKIALQHQKLEEEKTAHEENLIMQTIAIEQKERELINQRTVIMQNERLIRKMETLY